MQCKPGSHAPVAGVWHRWFHDTLVDGDLAINSMMWQVHSSRSSLLGTVVQDACSPLGRRVVVIWHHCSPTLWCPSHSVCLMLQNAGKCGLDQWNFTLLPTSSSQVSFLPPASDLHGPYAHSSMQHAHGMDFARTSRSLLLVPHCSLSFRIYRPKTCCIVVRRASAN